MSFQRTCRKYHEGVRRSDSTCFHDVRRRSTSCGNNAGLPRRLFVTPGQVGMCVTAATLQNAVHDLFRNGFPLLQIERSVGAMGVDDGVRGLHASLFGAHCTMCHDRLARPRQHGGPATQASVDLARKPINILCHAFDQLRDFLPSQTLVAWGLHIGALRDHGCSLLLHLRDRDRRSCFIQRCVLKRRRGFPDEVHNLTAHRGKGGRHDLRVTFPVWPRRTYYIRALGWYFSRTKHFT